jgi:hypothetical protein
LDNAFDDLTDKENMSFRYEYWRNPGSSKFY